MKALLASVVLSLSLSTFAESISISYSGMESWGQTYYSCAYVEARTKQVLERLMAYNIRVDCFGGIENGRMSPVSLEASFDVPHDTGISGYISLRGDQQNPACGLNVAIINNVLPKFPFVKVVSKDDRCASPRSNYKFDLALKF